MHGASRARRSRVLTWVAIVGCGAVVSMVLGGAAAWWMHRRTRLSPWNVYLAWIMCVGVSPAVIAAHGLAALGVTLVALAGATTASVVAHRWRVSALVPAVSCASTSAPGSCCGRRCAPGARD